MQAQSEHQRALALASHAAHIERYDDLPVCDRKRILGSSIDAVILKRGHARVPIEDRATILWHGEGPDDLPRRGHDNSPVRPSIPYRQRDHTRMPFAQHERERIKRSVHRGPRHVVSGWGGTRHTL